MHLTKGKNIKKKNCKIKIMAKAITSSLELQEKNLENKNIRTIWSAHIFQLTLVNNVNKMGIKVM